MNGQNFGERFYVSDKNERIDQDPSAPIANPDPVAGEAPVLTALVEQTPTGSGTIPHFGAPDEAIVHQAPVDEVIPYDAPPVEAMHYNDPVSEAIPDDEQVTKVNVIPYPAPISETSPDNTPGGEAGAGLPAALLDPFESEHLRTRWNEIQSKFVDEPRSAVQQADGLVSEVVEKITQMFASEHHTLEEQWKQGNNVSTEELRKALQHYRTFFNRLVV